MNLVFFGSGTFGLDTLEALSAGGHRILAAVLPPARPHGRGLKVSEPPLIAVARAKGIRVLSPHDVNASDTLALFRSLGAPCFVVVSFGAIFSEAFLAIPQKGCLNLHASLLPKYRGASPVAAALANGDAETGVSVIQLVRKLDAGDILAQERMPLSGEENAREVTDRLAAIGAACVVRTLRLVESGEIRPRRQDEALATNAPKLRKEDGWINWRLEATALHNRVRAYFIWPGSRTRLGGKALTILRTRVDAGAAPGGVPGTVVDPDHASGIRVACGGGALFIRELQIEGKRALPHREFLNGHPLRRGDRFEGRP